MKGKLRRSLVQFVKFGVVGMLNNLGGYLIYLAITWAGADPTWTVALLYPVGVIVNYVTHARYSFGERGDHAGRLPRYVVVQLIGYLLNIGMIYLFVDRWGLRHELVQFVAIAVVGVVLFVLMKLFVFAPRERPAV